MPLVPLNQIKRWYRTDSVIYKNFVYLFQNPLWSNNVPKGFSLCPFFWLSLISLFVLRPVIFLWLVFSFFIKISRLDKLIKYTDALVRPFFTYKKAPTGFLTFLSIGLLWCLGFVLYVIGYSCYLLALGFYLTNLLPLPCFASAAILGLFGLMYLNRLNSIPTKVYRRIYWCFAAYTITCIAFYQPEMFLDIIYSMLSPVWNLLSIIGIFVYNFSTGIYNYVINTTMEVTALFINYWMIISIFFLAAGLYISYLWRTEVSRQWVVNSYNDMLLRRIRIKILNKIVHIIALKFAYDDDKEGNYSYWEKYLKNSPTVWRFVRQIVDSRAWYQVDLEKIRASISDERIKQIEDAFYQEYLDDKKAEELRAMCQKPIDVMGSKMRELIELYKQTFLHKFIILIGKFIALGFKHFITLLCVGWELIKAKKNGACPYLVFEQVNNQQNPNN